MHRPVTALLFVVLASSSRAEPDLPLETIFKGPLERPAPPVMKVVESADDVANLRGLPAATLEALRKLDYKSARAFVLTGDKGVAILRATMNEGARAVKLIGLRPRLRPGADVGFGQVVVFHRDQSRVGAAQRLLRQDRLDEDGAWSYWKIWLAIGESWEQGKLAGELIREGGHLMLRSGGEDYHVEVDDRAVLLAPGFDGSALPVELEGDLDRQARVVRAVRRIDLTGTPHAIVRGELTGKLLASEPALEVGGRRLGAHRVALVDESVATAAHGFQDGEPVVLRGFRLETDRVAQDRFVTIDARHGREASGQRISYTIRLRQAPTGTTGTVVIRSRAGVTFSGPLKPLDAYELGSPYFDFDPSRGGGEVEVRAVTPQGEVYYIYDDDGLSNQRHIQRSPDENVVTTIYFSRVDANGTTVTRMSRLGDGLHAKAARAPQDRALGQ